MIRNSIASIALLLISTVGVWAGYSKLDALSMIESGDNDGAIGRAGEVSRYQIKPWIWRKYSKAATYRDSQVSRAVAEKYLADLEETFRKRTGREPDDFDLYVLWNAGPTYYGKAGFSKNRVNRIVRERAQRFVNLRQKQDPPAVWLNQPTPTNSVSSGAETPTAMIGNADSNHQDWPSGGLPPNLARPAALVSAVLIPPAR